jgi:hypothetical protein
VSVVWGNLKFGARVPAKDGETRACLRFAEAPCVRSVDPLSGCFPTSIVLWCEAHTTGRLGRGSTKKEEGGRRTRSEGNSERRERPLFDSIVCS